MYSKAKTLKLIAKNAIKFQNALGLKSWRIKFHVYRSGAKALLKMGVNRSTCTGHCGMSFISVPAKHADIIIYYNELVNEKDAYGTIVHELLHCSLAKLTSNITLQFDKAIRDEEIFVLHLEKIFVEKYK